MLGNLIGSVVIGLCVGVAIYLMYGMERFKTSIGANRVQSAFIIGGGVAVLGFVLRWLGWL